MTIVKRFFRTIQVLVAGDTTDDTKNLVGPRTEVLTTDDNEASPYFVAEVSSSLKVAQGSPGVRLPFGSVNDPVLAASMLFVSTDKNLRLTFSSGPIITLTPRDGSRAVFYADANGLGECTILPQGTGFHDVFFAVVGSAPT